MDITEKMVSFQIIQNVLILKRTLSENSKKIKLIIFAQFVHDFSQFFFQAEDGIRDVERSRGLGDVYKRQLLVLLKKFNMDITEKMVSFQIIQNLSLIHI